MSGSSPSTAAEDNAEMDAFIRKVEARDLIEFGMIPVSIPCTILEILKEVMLNKNCFLRNLLEDFRC